MRRLFALTLAFSLFFALAAYGQTLSFSLTLEDLAPGVPQTQLGTIHLERDATLRGLTWIQLEGILEDASIEVEVCVPGDWCVDATNPDDSIFPAGTLDVLITATLAADAEAGGSGTAVGQLTFFADDDEEDPDLPFTGLEFLGFMAWAIALVSVGSLLVVVARRRREEEAA